MIPKIDRDTLRELRRQAKEGRQDEVDQTLGFVICRQQVEGRYARDSWTRVRINAGFNWQVKAWLRDHCAGSFADLTLEQYDQMSDSALFDLDAAGGGEHLLAFENPDDAFAFKMRWHGEANARDA